MKTDMKKKLDAVFAAPTLGAPENSVGFVLWRLVHRYVRELDRELAGLDLTHLQFTILALAAWLARSSEVVTQPQLARFGDIHPMQVSKVLKVLEDKSLVRRPGSEADTRVRLVAITTTGVTALGRALPIAVEVQARLFGPGGRPGGILLTALLELNTGSTSADRPAHVDAPAASRTG